MDPSVHKRLRELVQDGVRTVAEVKRHINFFVKHETVGNNAPVSSRMWYPTSSAEIYLMRLHEQRHLQKKQSMTKKIYACSVKVG